MRATIERIEAKIYPKYEPFSDEEIDAFIGLLFANGLSPKPQIKFWFKDNDSNKIFGNNAFERHFSDLAPDGLPPEL